MTADSAADHQPDAILLDEPSTADLRAKVTEAWREFAAALAALLPTLSTGAHVDLTLDPTASGTGTAVYSVSLRLLDDGVIEALAVGNAGLPEGFRMDRSAVADLVALGWSPPGVLPGSGDSFGLRSSTTPGEKLATVVSRTLRDVYGAPHPAFLVYLVHDGDDRPIDTLPLATARHEPAADAEDTPESQSDAPALAADRGDPPRRTGPHGRGDDVQDRCGPTAGRHGRGHRHPGRLGHGVRPGPRQPAAGGRVLADPHRGGAHRAALRQAVGAHQPHADGRLYCAQDTVWASIPVFGRNFQATHLMLAVQVMTGLADELDDRLHGEFGGKRFFGEGDKPGGKDDSDHRPGMYL